MEGVSLFLHAHTTHAVADEKKNVCLRGPRRLPSMRRARYRSASGKSERLCNSQRKYIGKKLRHETKSLIQERTHFKLNKKKNKIEKGNDLPSYCTAAVLFCSLWIAASLCAPNLSLRLLTYLWISWDRPFIFNECRHPVNPWLPVTPLMRPIGACGVPPKCNQVFCTIGSWPTFVGGAINFIHDGWSPDMASESLTRSDALQCVWFRLKSSLCFFLSRR